ncbi:MAG: ABC transporter permease [Bryobacteraceae bacterium]
MNLPGSLQARWLSFRLRPGEDASCLNLYQPQNPRVLGFPESWMKLDPVPDGIAAAVDANTLQYSFHKKVGDTIEVGGVKLKIVRALPDSTFQSELLIADADFRRAFPEEEGYRVFLIDASAGQDSSIEKALSDYGMDLTTTASRKEAYHRVENTYLSTFQALGGLGLVLGTIGLAAILLRNVLERRREIGLLRAVGYNTRHLSTMVLAENSVLLTAGLGIGILCALVVVIPVALQRGGSVPWIAILGLLLSVAVTGFVSTRFAIWVIARSPLLASIRTE